MGWLIQCNAADCGQQVWAENVVDLISNHTDDGVWFQCPAGHAAYIEKSFNLQEPGDRWEPYLRGVISLGNSGDTYQPFVFLVSYEPVGPVTDVWFSYYKDLRASGGRLKLGYGPGGPPVLAARDVVRLVEQLHALGSLSDQDLAGLRGE